MKIVNLLRWRLLIALSVSVGIVVPNLAVACSEFRVGLTIYVESKIKDFNEIPTNMPFIFEGEAFKKTWNEIQSDLQIRVWSERMDAEVPGRLFWWPNDIESRYGLVHGLVSWTPNEPFPFQDKLHVVIDVQNEGYAPRHYEFEAMTIDPIDTLAPPPSVAMHQRGEARSWTGRQICCETEMRDSCGSTRVCEMLDDWVYPLVKFRTDPIGPAVVRIHRLDERYNPVEHHTVALTGAPDVIVDRVVFPERQTKYCVQLEVVDLIGRDSVMGEIFCDFHGDVDLPRFETLGEPVELLENSGSMVCIGSIFDPDTDEVVVPYPFDESSCSCGFARPISHQIWILLIVFVAWYSGKKVVRR